MAPLQSPPTRHAPIQQTRRQRGLTLLEVLVVLAILTSLSVLLIPAVARSRRSAQRATCLSNLRQQGAAWRLYLDENGSRFPDRRDLKRTLVEGYQPWTGWPKSDPRAGWAAIVLGDVNLTTGIWACPSARSAAWRHALQARQFPSAKTNAEAVRYWMWRFDRTDEPVPGDNFWNRSEEECLATLRTADSPQAGQPSGPGEVELAVDAYFPNTIPAVAEALQGRTAHAGGRNRLMLDGHVEYTRDPRTPRF